MRIEFDPEKDRINRRQHGVSLDVAATLFWDDAITWIDDRFHYDEYRLCAIVRGPYRLYFAAFADRQQLRRIISLRHATKKEINRYAEHHKYR